MLYLYLTSTPMHINYEIQATLIILEYTAFYNSCGLYILYLSNLLMDGITS